MEKLLNKYWSWGSKKEYNSIVSILVAIIFPIIGLAFVNNQASFKLDYNHKAHGLFLIALLISVLWWGVLFLLLIIFI